MDGKLNGDKEFSARLKSFSENTEKQFPISSETSRNVIFREFQCFVDYLQRICPIKRS